MADFGTFIKYFLIYFIGFTLGSYGGLFSEASGIINIALEGSMVFGAFAGIVTLQLLNSALEGSILVTTLGGLALIYLIAGLVAILFSLLYSFLLSFVAIKLKANQTIVGTALNTLAVAICTIVNSVITRRDTPETSNNVFASVLQLHTGNQFIDSAFSGLNITILVGVLLIIFFWLLLNKMRFGLRLRACGENPAAADSVGINVNRMRYIGTAIGSSCAGFAGFIIFSCLPLQTWQIDALGYGFLVLAIEIFGNWKASNIIFASIFFAFFFSFAPALYPVLARIGVGIPRAFYYLLPYLLALVSLVIFSRHSHAPKAEGIPYDKGAR